MTDWTIFLPLMAIGLVSSGHCIGMCGGIMGALTLAIPADAKKKRWIILLAYNFGRIGSYALMGLLAGFFAQQLAALGGAQFLRIIAGLLLIAMGLYLANWWRGLTYLEKMGRYLWAYLQPLGRGLMPVNNVPKALGLGAVWGWLPCGLVYSALALAMTQPSPAFAAGAMFAFGLGTLPAVIAAGIIAQQLAKLLQKNGIRLGLAILVMLYGAWTLYGGFMGHGTHDHHSMGAPSHSHHHAPSSELNKASSSDGSSVNTSVQSSAAAQSHHHEH